MKNDKLKLEYATRGECRNTTSEWRQACNQLRDLPKISQLVVAIDFNGGRNWRLMISYTEQDLTGKSSMFGHQSMEAQNYIALSQLKKEFLFSLVQADRFWAKPLEIFAVCGKVCRFRVSNKLPIPQTLFSVLLWLESTSSLDSACHWSFRATYESVQLFVIWSWGQNAARREVLDLLPEVIRSPAVYDKVRGVGCSGNKCMLLSRQRAAFFWVRLTARALLYIKHLQNFIF